MAWVGAAVCCACVIWLACLFFAKPDHGATMHVCDAGRSAIQNNGSACIARFRGGLSSAAAPGGTGGLNQIKETGSPAKDETYQDSSVRPEDCSTEEQFDEAAEDLCNFAARKEQMIEERFGVILRQGKWIPTIGGGTNLVYITTGSLPHGRVGEAYEVQFEAVSGSPPYAWRLVGDELPSSIAFDSNSGNLNGVPLEPTTVCFFLEVIDSRGARDLAEYVLMIQPDQPLAIATKILPAAIPGEVYTVQLEARGGIPPYVWSAAGDTDEIGIFCFDPHTGQLHGGIFADAPSMDIPITFLLSDAQMDVSEDLMLHVRTGLSILEVPSASVLESETFKFAFQAAGGVEPCIWSFMGDLPPGLDFFSTGLCSGELSQAGLYEIHVYVQDANGQVDSAHFTLEVVAVLADSLACFEALLSRNSVALSWLPPATNEDFSVRVVRKSDYKPSSPSDGTTIYLGNETSFVDRDVGAGRYYYSAFLEESGSAVTSAPTLTLYAELPPGTDPFVDAVVSCELLHQSAFRASELPDIVLGPPTGGGIAKGSLNVVSLGAASNDDGGVSAPYGGSITLEFVDNVVWNGPGADFTVFENVFYIHDEQGVPDLETRFMEPAIVSVSQDGIVWHQFKIDFSPRYDSESGELNLRHPYCYNSGFAGVNPVISNGLDPDPTDPEISGGDSFDLSDLCLDWIRYVHIQSTGNRWLVDKDGDIVCHTEEFGAASRSSATSGFDLDAVTAIWMTKVAAE